MSDEPDVRSTKGSTVYPQVARVIEKLGRDISLARRGRRITADAFAAQMGVSRMTLHRLETGDPGASLNTLCMAMHALGLLENVAGLADPGKDDVGMMMAKQEAPARVRRSRGHRPRGGDDMGAAAELGEPVANDDGYVGF